MMERDGVGLLIGKTRADMSLPLRMEKGQFF